MKSVSLKLLVLAGLLISPACAKKSETSKPPDVDYYTCTMHPSVKKQNPTDKCPICSMDLTPVKKKDVGASERPSVEASATLHAPDAPRSDALHGPGRASASNRRHLRHN